MSNEELLKSYKDAVNTYYHLNAADTSESNYYNLLHIIHSLEKEILKRMSGGK